MINLERKTLADNLARARCQMTQAESATDLLRGFMTSRQKVKVDRAFEALREVLHDLPSVELWDR